jgi:hypothetical protein
LPGSSKYSFSLRFPHQNPVYTSPLSIHTTCPTHLILLNLIARMIFGEEYRSLCSSLSSFLHSPVTLSLLDPNILLKHPILEQTQPTFLPQYERPSFTPMQSNRQNYNSVCLYFFIANWKSKDSTPNDNIP